MTLTSDYGRQRRADRMARDVAGLRDETKRDPDLHWHPIGERKVPPDICAGCALAQRLDNVLMEAAQ